MITINNSFMTSIGVVSVNNCPNAVNNQYDFFKSVELASGTVNNRYDFFKNVTVDGVNYINEYGFYKAIGEFYGEPIYDQYSFFQNATFDGTNPIGNQYNFFKDICTYISGGTDAPTANFTADVTTTYTLDTVTFTDTSTTPGPSITGWTWDFGDSTSATTQNPTHVYSAVTQETVALTVSSSGGTDTETKVNYINVINAVPTANWSADTMTGYTLDTVSFTDLSTTPSANHPVNAWSWDFDDTTTSTSQNPTHAFSSVTTFDVVLSASTDQGTDTYQQTITMINAVPTANFSYTPSTGDTTTSFSFTDTSTTPSANHPVNAWLWDFGDGVTANTQNPSHVYSAITTGGTYSVSLTAYTDQGNDVVTKTDIITVSAPSGPTPEIYLDAYSGETSYTGGTTWYDISNDYDATLRESSTTAIGPVWDNDIMFDFTRSSNDNCYIGSYSATSSACTFTVAFRFDGSVPTLAVGGANQHWLVVRQDPIGPNYKAYLNKGANLEFVVLVNDGVGQTVLTLNADTFFSADTIYVMTVTNGPTEGFKVYINNNLELSGTFRHQANNDGDTFIGTDSGTSRSWDRQIGMFRYFNVEMTASEVEDEYNLFASRYGL